ncbi:MAG TPA: SDR family oxidoreductase [Methanoregulaceae archaeon]|nr:SDR family oxidoreductase [Methanoregulaceae archaeon]
MKEPIILVTGSTDGIGKATARVLASHGAHVILHGRDQEKGEKVIRELKDLTWNTKLDLIIADLSEQRNVIRLAEEVTSNYERLDVLINNAGVYEKRRRLTHDNIEMTFAVNYLAPFLLTRQLLPLLKKSAPSRVVNLASLSHRDIRQIDWENMQGEKHYEPFRAYALSKFADITFTYSLAEQLAGKGVTVNCLHPGVIASKLLHAGFPTIRGKPPSHGAMIPVHLSLAQEVADISGEYFEESPQPSRSSSLTYNRTVQDRLWNVAEQLTE